MDWKRYWNSFPAQVAETDFLRQVGKTVGGQPLAAKQVDTIIYSIVNTLDIQPTERVLDLCCGNGLISHAVARHCERLIGVDYSETLIAVARKHHSAANVEYVRGSVLELSRLLIGTAPYDKIYMYEALQHFTDAELPGLLHGIADQGTVGVRVLFGGVPDAARLWRFYDTAERQEEYRRRLAAGTEAIGTWWDMGMLERICRKGGFTARVVAQSAALYGNHYRVDVVAERSSRPKRS